jgi:hypothetical protein
MIQHSVVLILAWWMGLSSLLYAREAIWVQPPRPEPIRRVEMPLPDTLPKTVAPMPQSKKTLHPVVPQQPQAKLTPVANRTIVKTERPILIPPAQAMERNERLPFLGLLKVVVSIKQSLKALRKLPLMQNLEEGLAKPLVYIGLGIVILFAGAFVPIDWIKIIAFFVGLILLGLGIYYLILFLQDQ